MLTIRQATVHDSAALTDLRVTFFEEIDGTSGAQREAFREATTHYFARVLAEGTLLAWIAEVDGAIVATSGLLFFDQAPTPGNLSGKEAYIFNIYTVPAWRGQGIARKVMQELISCARACGAQYFWLYATEQGRPLYEKLDFVTHNDAMGLFYPPASEQDED